MCLQGQKPQKRKRNFKNAPGTTKKKDDNLTNQTSTDDLKQIDKWDDKKSNAIIKKLKLWLENMFFVKEFKF